MSFLRVCGLYLPRSGSVPIQPPLDLVDIALVKVFRAQPFLPAQLFKFLVSDMAGAAAHDGIDDLADTLLARVVVQHLRQHRYFQSIVPTVDFPVAVPVYAGM